MRRALPILLRKELLEAWRTYRIGAVWGLFLLVGLSSPLLARFTPELIRAAAGDVLGGFPVPVPTAADAVGQVQKNLAQFGSLAAILLAMGAVAAEVDRGTAAFILARPVPRPAFLAAKALAIGAVLSVGTALAVAVGWVYTAILFEPPPLGGWVAMAALTWLALAAWAALTFLASTLTGSAIAAGGFGLVALLVVSIAAVVPAVARMTPAGLAGPAIGLASGDATAGSLGSELWLPVVASILLVGACLAGAAVAFRRREL